jgi:hypothetical protein
MGTGDIYADKDEREARNEARDRGFMSMDEAGSGALPEVAEPKRKRGKATDGTVIINAPKVRKHLLTTAYKKEVAEKLDKLHSAGHTVLSITGSEEIRGFEIISYSEE